MRVCIAGSFVPDFPRNRKTRRLLALGAHEVTLCHVPIWPSDRIGLARRGRLSVVGRAFVAYIKLLLRLLRRPAPDIYLVGYPAWFDVPVVKLVALLKRRPLVVDLFISLYDTVVLDRHLHAPKSLLGRLCLAADRWTCRLATRVILDTDRHARHVAALTDVGDERFGVVPLGARDDLFTPGKNEGQEDLVVFHGTFVPLQGLSTIIRAAKLLEPHGIQLRVIGDGQDANIVKELVADLQPKNLTMLGLVPIEQVVQELRQASVCLGVFGTTEKATRVIPNKVYEGIAMGLPVVTGDTPAMQEGFDPGELIVVPVGDPGALASAILALLHDPEERERVAAAGRRRYEKAYREDVLARTLTRQLALLTPPR